MVTILGLLLFFGITATILWLFHEALWRADDLDIFELHLEQRSLDRSKGKEGHKEQGLDRQKPAGQSVRPARLKMDGAKDVTKNR
jgi:hypothetical protein